MGMEAILTALTGFLESLWEYVDQYLVFVGTSQPGTMANGSPYWASLVAAVRLDNGYLRELPPLVQRMARWVLAHDNKDKLKGR